MSTDEPWRITEQSTREEVLAAVEWFEASAEKSRRAIEAAEFPPVPEGFRGCVTSLDGSITAMYGPTRRNPSLEAQKSAGEEDQTREGWEPA